MNTTNIIIAGVGGQGSLLASRILGNAALLLGYDVKVSEVHGMSQRGGSVVTYVKYGDAVASPVICRGEADYLLSFELLESARMLPYLKLKGTVVTSTQRINPMPVITGAFAYPEGILEQMKEKKIECYSADALTLARGCGSDKAANVVMIGLFARHSSISKDIFLSAIAKSVPERSVDLNLKAFEAGYAVE